MTTQYRQHYAGVLNAFDFNGSAYNSLGAGFDVLVEGFDSGAITDMFQFDPNVVSERIVVAPENSTTGPAADTPIVVPPYGFDAYLAGREF